MNASLPGTIRFHGNIVAATPRRRGARDAIVAQEQAAPFYLLKETGDAGVAFTYLRRRRRSHIAGYGS